MIWLQNRSKQCSNIEATADCSHECFICISLANPMFDFRFVHIKENIMLTYNASV